MISKLKTQTNQIKK